MAWFAGIEVIILVLLSLIGLMAVLLPQQFSPIYSLIAIRLSPLLSLVYMLEWGLKTDRQIAQWQRKGQFDLLAIQPYGVPVLLWGLLQSSASPRLLVAIPALAFSAVFLSGYQALFTQVWQPLLQNALIACGITFSMIQFTAITGLIVILNAQLTAFQRKISLSGAAITLHLIFLAIPLLILSPVLWIGALMIGEGVVWGLWHRMIEHYGETPI
jgi:hypothetical protein